MNTSLILLAFLFILQCSMTACTPKHTDQASIQGVWLAQTESQNGHKKKVTYQYIFSRDQVYFIDENAKEMKYSFKLDPANNPKLCTIQPAESPTKSTPVSVAYELNRDSLTIVVAPPGKVPTEISDKHNQELIICKRKSP